MTMLTQMTLFVVLIYFKFRADFQEHTYRAPAMIYP